MKSCGGRTRTCDLQVMSLASYQLLHSAMFNLKSASFLICVCKGTVFWQHMQIFSMFFLFFQNKKRVKTLANGRFSRKSININRCDKTTTKYKKSFQKRNNCIYASKIFCRIK